MTKISVHFGETHFQVKWLDVLPHHTHRGGGGDLKHNTVNHRVTHRVIARFDQTF